MVNKQFEQVKAFHTACGIEMPEKPTMLVVDIETAIHFKRSIKTISERMKNFSKYEGGSPLGDRISYFLEEIVELANATTIEDQVDALTDLVYFAVGTFTLMGVEPENIFDIVHNANMGKVGPDGRVERDEQGKIKKPAGWADNFAPERHIKVEIERQSKGK